jgi:hypothetical protein
MKELAIVPNGYDEIIEVYGKPDINVDGAVDFWFIRNRLSIFELPFRMRLSWDKNKFVNFIQCHIDIGDVVVDALKEIKGHKGYGYLFENGFDYYGGCFNFRVKRGGKDLSTHAWGIAIDLNPHIAPYGEQGNQPDFIIEAFVKRGFEWGGNWEHPDPMHFQACRGY